MDTFALVGDGLAPGRPCRRPRKTAKFQINLFWIIVAAANFVVFFLIVQRIAFGGLRQDPRRPARPDRAGAEGRGAGPPRPGIGRAGAARRPAGGPSRGQRDPQPRPEGRVGDARAGHRGHPRRDRPPARARDRRDRGGEAARHRRAPGRGHRPRPRGRRPRRRRVDDRRPPAQARGRVPRRSGLRRGPPADGTPHHRRPPLRGGGLPGRPARRRARRLARRPRDRGRDPRPARRRAGRRQPGHAARPAARGGRPSCSRADPPRGALRLVEPAGRARPRPRPARASARSTSRLLNAHRGIVVATVTSAVPLTTDETAEIRTRVEAMAGSTVDLRTEVDPALLGGLTVQVGDRLLDASIRGRLERLRDQLHTGTRPR